MIVLETNRKKISGNSIKKNQQSSIFATTSFALVGCRKSVIFSKGGKLAISHSPQRQPARANLTSCVRRTCKSSAREQNDAR